MRKEGEGKKEEGRRGSRGRGRGSREGRGAREGRQGASGRLLGAARARAAENSNPSPSTLGAWRALCHPAASTSISKKTGASREGQQCASSCRLRPLASLARGRAQEANGQQQPARSAAVGRRFTPCACETTTSATTRRAVAFAACWSRRGTGGRARRLLAVCSEPLSYAQSDGCRLLLAAVGAAGSGVRRGGPVEARARGGASDRNRPRRFRRC